MKKITFLIDLSLNLAEKIVEYIDANFDTGSDIYIDIITLESIAAKSEAISYEQLTERINFFDIGDIPDDKRVFDLWQQIYSFLDESILDYRGDDLHSAIAECLYDNPEFLKYFWRIKPWSSTSETERTKICQNSLDYNFLEYLGISRNNKVSKAHNDHNYYGYNDYDDYDSDDDYEAGERFEGEFDYGYLSGDEDYEY